MKNMVFQMQNGEFCILGEFGAVGAFEARLCSFKRF